MTKSFFTLGNAAVGTIEPHENQQDRLEEFTSRVASGEFHVPIEHGISIPARCVDGRSLEEGVHPLAPNAAGGSESLFVADDLTTRHFTGSDESVLQGYVNTLDALQSAGHEIGGHTDSHAMGAKSGCGANDRLAEIYRFIASNGDTLRETAARLGVDVPQDTHELITANAAKRATFSEGAEVFEQLNKKAKKEFVDILGGEHNEVLVAVNTRPNTTLDRAALRAEFGNTYQVFNVDVWSFAKAAGVGSKSSRETDQRLAAMVYYNLATAMVLGGPALRVVAVE